MFAAGDNVRVVGVDGMLIRPDIGPLTTLLVEGMKKAKKRGQSSTLIEWKEDDWMTQWVVLDVAALIGDTVISLVDSKNLVPGDVIYFPPANATVTHGELLRVTANNITTNDITVTRAFAGTTAAAIANGSALSINGPAINEGAAAPEAKSTIAVTKSTYMQHFGKTKKITLEQAASNQYASPQGLRDELQSKMMNEMKLDFNKTAYWGKTFQDLNDAGGEMRTMAGLRSEITTNVVDAGGLLTYKGFLGFCEKVFTYHDSQSELGLLCPAVVINAINAWQHQFVRVGPTEKMYGVKTKLVQTGFGDLRLIHDKTLETLTGQTRGFGHIAFAVDFANIEIVFLQGNGASYGEPTIMEDVIKDGSGKIVDQTRMICGLKVRHQAKHGVLQNVTDYTAPF
jgi:hypothetical protein